MPSYINFNNVVKRKTEKFIENIKEGEKLLENNGIMIEFKRKEFTILKKAGLPFLVKNFQSFDHSKKIDSIILINIGFLSISKTTGIQIKDLDFLEFIINLLSSNDYYKYGIISLHLLLNRYVRYERNIQGYNNFFFQLLMKEIAEPKRDSLYQTIIEGLSNNKEIEKNPDHFFETIDKHISTDFKNIDKLTFDLFFQKIFEANVNLLKKYKRPLFNLVESHVSRIFQKDNVFMAFKHIYVNLYNKDEDIFQKLDGYLNANIENIGFFSKLIDLINHFMPSNYSHPFFKKFYKKYFNLSYQLKDQKKFPEIGLLWDGFNIHSLKNPKDGQIIDKKFFQGLIDDFQVVLSSGESTLFNARYMELEELLKIRPVVEPIKLLKRENEGMITLDNLIQILLKDMATLQQAKNVPKEEEDKYTIFLSKLLNNSLKPFKFYTSVQDLSGKTEKIKNENPELGGIGNLDLSFYNGDGILCHIGETLILHSINRDYTKTHLKKIFDYDANGLPVNFMIIYSKVKNFDSLWQKYSNLVKEYKFEYPLVDKEFIDLSNKVLECSGIKVGLTRHLRDGRICTLYHFFIDFN